MTTGALGSISLTTCESGLPLPLTLTDLLTVDSVRPTQRTVVKLSPPWSESNTALILALLMRYIMVMLLGSLKSVDCDLNPESWLTLLLSEGCMNILMLPSSWNWLSMMSNISYMCVPEEVPALSNSPLDGDCMTSLGSLLKYRPLSVKESFLLLLGSMTILWNTESCLVVGV